MTGLNMLDAMAEFIFDAVKDMELKVREKNADGGYAVRAARIYKMRLPDKEANIKQIPYILLQAVKGEDDEEKKRHICSLRAVIAVFDDVPDSGAASVLTVIERIRIAMRRAGIIQKKYGIGKIEYLIYPADDDAPYYMGEMMIEIDLPIVKRDLFPECLCGNKEIQALIKQ